VPALPWVHARPGKEVRNYKANGKPFEIVFVSSDKDQSQFESYYAEQPWLALPYEERDLKGKLSSKFGVKGIPTLVILDEDGTLITKDGRSAVTGDEDGSNFPWRPKSMPELIGETLTKSGGGEVSVSSALEGKDHIMLYFSAHWCGPCRGFTPDLVKFYNANAASSKFELIFVSSDQDEKQFNDYHGEMPWPALPYARRGDKEALSKRLEVEGIPTLVVLDKEFNVITKSGRAGVSEDPTAKDFPWPPKPVGNLKSEAEANGFDINSKPAVCLMFEQEDDDAQATMAAAMLTVANASKAAGAGKDEGPEFICFTCNATGGIGDRVRELTKTEKKTENPLLLILDIPDNGGFYVSDATDFDEPASIEAFIQAWRSKSAKRQQLS